MANNYTEIMKIVNQGNKMGLSNTITRDNGIPLDLSSVQESYNAAVIYAATKAIAYQGQLLAAEGVVYIIVAESQGQVEIDGTTYENYLKPVGTIPGFDEADNDTLPQIKIDAEGNRTLEWVSISAIVEGDGNSVTTLVALDKSVTITDTAEEGFEGHKYTVQVNISKEEGNSLSLKDDGLYVTVPEITHPEYAVKADERAEGATATTYHLTKDGENVDVAIVVPDAYNDEALDTRLTVVEGTVGDHETRLGKVEDFFKTAEGESLNEALDTLAEIQKEIAADDASAAAMLSSINANTTAIEVLNGTGEGSVDKKVSDAISAHAEEAAKVYATKQDLTDHSNTMDTKLNDYLKSADAEDTYAKIGDAYTKSETDALIGIPGTPAEGEEGEEGYVAAVPGTGVYQHVYSKDEVTALIADITGGESAADVLAALNAYKTTNNTRVKAVEDKNSTQDTAIGTAQSAAEGAQAAAEAAQGTADGAAAQAATNKTDIAGILTRLGNVETASGTNTSKVSALEGKITALEAEDTELAGKIGTVEGNLSTLETNLTAEDARIAALVQGNTDAIKLKANAADVYTKGEVDTKVQEAIDAIPEVDFTPYLKSEDAAKTYATITSVEEIYKAGVDGADATGLLANEIARAKAAEQANADAIALLTENPTEAIDSVKELIAHVNEQGTEVAGIITRLDGHDSILAGIGGEGEKATVKAYVDDAIAAIPTYELPAATTSALGGIKASESIAVAADGTATVAKVTTDVLVNGTEEFVLNGGNAKGASNV